MDISDQAHYLKQHRDCYGAVLGELLAKAYHVLPTEPTVPEVFIKSDTSVKNNPMQLDSARSCCASSSKIWTAVSVLHQAAQLWGWGTVSLLHGVVYWRSRFSKPHKSSNLMVFYGIFPNKNQPAIGYLHVWKAPIVPQGQRLLDNSLPQRV